MNCVTDFLHVVRAISESLCQTVLIAQMQQLFLKTQRFSVFGTHFDVSNIIIRHYKCIEKICKMIGIYNYSYTMNLYELKYASTVKLI